jgi:CheY-like chemotaxis protein
VPSSATRVSVLLAEDDDSLRTMLELVLQREGYEVHACGDGARAREALASAAAGGSHLDVALLDLRMPGVTGTELLAQIRASAVLRPLHVRDVGLQRRRSGRRRARSRRRRVPAEAVQHRAPDQDAASRRDRPLPHVAASKPVRPAPGPLA